MLDSSSKSMPAAAAAGGNNNYHNILPRVLSFYTHWKKIYGELSFTTTIKSNQVHDSHSCVFSFSFFCFVGFWCPLILAFWGGVRFGVFCFGFFFPPSSPPPFFFASLSLIQTVCQWWRWPPCICMWREAELFNFLINWKIPISSILFLWFISCTVSHSFLFQFWCLSFSLFSFNPAYTLYHLGLSPIQSADFLHWLQQQLLFLPAAAAALKLSEILFSIFLFLSLSLCEPWWELLFVYYLPLHNSLFSLEKYLS